MNHLVLFVCVVQVTATDADGGSFGSISYSLGSGMGSTAPSQFTISKETGQICTAVALDRDQGPSSYDFTVTAVDGVSYLILVVNPLWFAVCPVQAGIQRLHLTLIKHDTMTPSHSCSTIHWH